MNRWNTIQSALTFFATRWIVLYLAAGILLWKSVDCNKAFWMHVDYLKGAEKYAVWYSRDRVRFDASRLQTAVKYYERLQKRFPDSAKVYANLGFCYAYLDELPRALKAYEKAMELAPRDYAFPYDAGIVLDHMGKSKEAAEYWKKANGLINVYLKQHQQMITAFAGDRDSPPFLKLQQSTLKALKDWEILQILLAREESHEKAQSLKDHPGKLHINPLRPVDFFP